MRHLIVDGMFSGTGVRDAVDGGFVDLSDLGISVQLANDLASWVLRFEAAHYRQFRNSLEVVDLELTGTELARRLKSELADTKIQYCSCVTLKCTVIE